VQRTITLDSDVNQTLREHPYINASALINDLLKQYFKATPVKGEADWYEALAKQKRETIIKEKKT